MVKSTYADMFVNQGIYRAAILGDTVTGIGYFRKALELTPNHPAAEGWLDRLGA
jgi:hypothetical protein